jgi:hypothetical protein
MPVDHCREIPSAGWSSGSLPHRNQLRAASSPLSDPHCPRFFRKTYRPIRSMGIAAFRSTKKDSEAYEISGLDIACKRAMFQKFEMICLALLGFPKP